MKAERLMHSVTKNTEYLRKRLQEWAGNCFCFLCRPAPSHLIWVSTELPREGEKPPRLPDITMCYGKCARCIGHLLVWLAVLCIVANILLYFPNGETRYASENHLSRFVWFFSGIIGGGLLIFLPAFVFMGLEQDDCCGCCGHENCGKRCAMLSSVLVALIGIAGSGYCVIVAALGLAEGPRCLDYSGRWNYTFANTEGQYLLDRSTWSQCIEPKHVVEWNVSLFSILLGLGGIEFILCLIQVINGVLGGICGYCCSRQQQYDC